MQSEFFIRFYRKALNRQMVGLPSQLGYQIVNDICKKPVKLSGGCCCEGAALALWTDKLPVSVRAHISNMQFTKDTYKDVFETADKYFLSSKQLPAAAAISSVPDSLDETLPAFNTQNQPQQVAAVANRGGRGRGNRGQNRGNRGGRGGQNRGQSNQQTNQAQGKPRGPRHHSSPPDQCCERHFKHGDQAWFCVAPLTCPWVNKVQARP